MKLYGAGTPGVEWDGLIRRTMYTALLWILFESGAYTRKEEAKMVGHKNDAYYSTTSDGTELYANPSAGLQIDRMPECSDERMGGLVSSAKRR